MNFAAGLIRPTTVLHKSSTLTNSRKYFNKSDNHCGLQASGNQKSSSVSDHLTEACNTMHLAMFA